MPFRQAADELIVLCYSTNQSPARTARVAGYLALLVHCTRSELEDYMQRRQEELAGGPCEPVAGLAAASRAICAAADRREDSEARIRAICEAREHERNENDAG
jgi:hypothetical protein